MKNNYASGLEVVAWIWLVLTGLGSLIGSIVIWSHSSYSYYSYGRSSTYVNETLVGIGFAVLFGGLLVSFVVFFLLACISSATQDLFEISLAQKRSDGGSMNSLEKSWSPRDRQDWMKTEHGSSKSETWFCPFCGRENSMRKDTCDCGKDKPLF